VRSPAAKLEKLLCVKIASRGDLLLAAPAFRALRRARPGAHLALAVGATCEDVARRLPYFDALRVIDDHALFSPSRLWRIRAAGGLLREMSRGYDELLVFHRDRRYSLLGRVAAIPLRRGLSDAAGAHHLTHAYAPAPEEHDSAQYLRMALPGSEAAPDALALAGLWRFLPGEREDALARAASLGFRPEIGSWVALGFGGGRNVKNQTDLKQWPVEHYRRLAERLVEYGYGVVWLGDAEDGRVLGESPPAGIVLSGALGVPGSAAVLSACALTVANDTLLLHLSEAVGTTSLGLFGPTDPANYGPQGWRSAAIWRGAALACSPCSRGGVIPPCPFRQRCLRELPVEAVLADALERLSAPAATCGTRRASGAAWDGRQDG
jgi:heptosyltransferase II